MKSNMSVLSDKSKAVVFVFRNLEGPAEVVKLKGIDPEAAYLVKELTRTFSGNFIGSELIEKGFIPELKNNAASAEYLIGIE